VEAQKKHQKEIAQLEEELQEVQQAMSQFEGEGSSQEDDLQLMDSQVMRLTMCEYIGLHFTLSYVTASHNFLISKWTLRKPAVSAYILCVAHQAAWHMAEL